MRRERAQGFGKIGEVGEWGQNANRNVACQRSQSSPMGQHIFSFAIIVLDRCLEGTVKGVPVL